MALSFHIAKEKDMPWIRALEAILDRVSGDIGVFIQAVIDLLNGL